MKRVYLEITNACNLNCSFCTNAKGHSYLDIDTIDNYLLQIKQVTNYIYLHVLGEPLLHPKFNEIMDLLDKYDFNLQLVTNGTLLSKYPNILSHKSLRKLSISLHSLNNLDIDDNYFNILDKLIENNNDKIIELRFYDLNNLDQKLNNYLNTLDNKYHFKDTKKDKSYKLKDKVYIYCLDMFKWPSINDEEIGETGYCHGLKDQLAILHNGIVTSCCLDPYGENNLGDLNNNSLKEILESTKYKKALSELKNRHLVLPLCKKCTYRLRFDK